MAHPSADSVLFIIHDEHTWTLSLNSAFVKAEFTLRSTLEMTKSIFLRYFTI
jgi:hypothetical protein